MYAVLCALAGRGCGLQADRTVSYLAVSTTQARP